MNWFKKPEQSAPIKTIAQMLVEQSAAKKKEASTLNASEPAHSQKVTDLRIAGNKQTGTAPSLPKAADLCIDGVPHQWNGCKCVQCGKTRDGEVVKNQGLPPITPVTTQCSVIESKCFVAEVLETDTIAYRVPIGSFSAPLDDGIRYGPYAKRFRLIADFKIACDLSKLDVPAAARRSEKEQIARNEQLVARSRKTWWMWAVFFLLAVSGLGTFVFMDGNQDGVLFGRFILGFVSFFLGLGFFISICNIFEAPRRIKKLKDKEAQPISQEDAKEIAYSSILWNKAEAVCAENLRRVVPNGRCCRYVAGPGYSGAEVGEFFFITESAVNALQRTGELKRNQDGTCEIPKFTHLPEDISDDFARQIARFIASQ